MRFLSRLAVLIVFAASVVAPAAGQSIPAPAMQLYTLDGGRLDFKSMGDFCDTGENAGKPGTLAVPCYLIHHGKD